MMSLGFGLLTPGLQRLYSWWTAKSKRDQLLENLDEARLFEEWEESAYQLDEVLGLDLWYVSPLKLVMYNSDANLSAGARIQPPSTTITASYTNASKPLLTPAKTTMFLVLCHSFDRAS
jgi:hypothetical protein